MKFKYEQQHRKTIIEQKKAMVAENQLIRLKVVFKFAQTQQKKEKEGDAKY